MVETDKRRETQSTLNVLHDNKLIRYNQHDFNKTNNGVKMIHFCTRNSLKKKLKTERGA